MITLIREDQFGATRSFVIPDLPEQITAWLNFMCEHYPVIMRELLAHDIGDLNSWFSAPKDDIPTNGCLVGSAALMMSKVMASTCTTQPSLEGTANVNVYKVSNNPRWSAAYYLAEFVSRCDPEYALAQEEWDLLTTPAAYAPRDYQPRERNLTLLPPERHPVLRKVIELYDLTIAAGCAAPEYADSFWELDIPDQLAQPLAIQAFKEYIQQRLALITPSN